MFRILYQSIDVYLSCLSSSVYVSVLFWFPPSPTQVSDELSEVWRRRTGSLSDNDMIDLDHHPMFDAHRRRRHHHEDEDDDDDDDDAEADSEAEDA